MILIYNTTRHVGDREAGVNYFYLYVIELIIKNLIQFQNSKILLNGSQIGAHTFKHWRYPVIYQRIALADGGSLSTVLKSQL